MITISIKILFLMLYFIIAIKFKTNLRPENFKNYFKLFKLILFLPLL